MIAEAARVAAAFDKNPAKKLYAFTEDKLTMSLESAIARSSGGTFNVIVSSFSRFIRSRKREEAVVLDKQSSVMAVRKILADLGDSLGCFSRSAYYPGTSQTLYELIAQLKSAKVGPAELASTVDDATLGKKLGDILNVFARYEEYIKEAGVYDSNSFLSLMPALVGEMEEGCSAMLVGFASLTRQGLDIVSALDKKAEQLTVITLAGDNEELYTNELKTLLMREIGDFSAETAPSSLCQAGRVIADRLFDPTAFSEPPVQTDKVFLYEAADPEEEVDHIASVIRREVVGGMRYREIAVAVGDAAAYSPVITKIFARYGIPCYIDDTRPLSAHPLARLAATFLEAEKTGFTPETAVSIEKNPYFMPDRDAADRFERFVVDNSVTARALREGLKPCDGGFECYGADYELFETERRRMLALRLKANSAAGFSDRINALTEAIRAEESCLENARKLREIGAFSEAAFTEQALGKLKTLLQSVTEVMGDRPLSAADYKNIFLAGLAATEVSTVPQLSDAVYVGDYKECKYLGHKLLFAAGLNGDVPFTRSDTALLNDRDLSRLERFNLFVDPKIKAVNKRERENVGAALISFTDRLYLSRSAAGADGHALSKGRIFEFMRAMFSANGAPLRVETESSLLARAENAEGFARSLSALRFSAARPGAQRFIEAAGEFRDGIRNDFSKEAAFFAALREVSPGDAAAAEELLKIGGGTSAELLPENGALVFKGDALSASILESYFACPSACFMKYGLKAEQDRDADACGLDYGNLLHAVLEDYVTLLTGKYADRLDSGDDSFTEAEIGRIFAARLSEFRFFRFLDEDRNAASFALVRHEAVRVAKEIFRQLKNGGFRPEAVEAAFRDNAKYPPIKIKTPYGVKKINGKIDRVDRCGDYVRIIDYKTGSISAEDEKFYTGNKLQLYLYMNAFLGKDDKPGGAYYFPVTDRFAEKGEFVYSMSGKTAADVAAVEAADRGAVARAKSDVLGTKIKTADGKVEGGASFLDEETFRAYLRYAILVSEKGASEIAEGVVAPSPYFGNCRYCYYSAACPFEAGDPERKEKGVNKHTVAEAAGGNDAR